MLGLVLGPWFVLAGSIAGALVVRSVSLALVAACLGAFGAAARRSGVAAVGVFLIGLGVVGLGASAGGGPAVVGNIARRVPICRFEADVRERAGALGTLLSVRTIECNGRILRGELGNVVVDGMRGEAGGTASGVGRLVPLGSTGFDAGRTRLGAQAALSPQEVDFRAPSSPVPAAAARLRRGVTEVGNAIGSRRGSLLAGLTIGDTSRMDPRTEEHMRRAGLSHLVAVSGSNVAIVVGAAMLAAGRAGKFMAVAAAATALLVYAVTVGPEPSVLRASAMAAIGLVALASGRRAEPLAALALALSVLLAARPQMIYSVGLQLSAVATAGLILWAAALADRLGRLPRPVALGAGATVAANVAVAPLLMGIFGEVSLVSPLANLLAMPAVPPATVLGLLAGLLSVVSAQLGAFTAHLAEPFVGWILAVGDAFGPLGFAAVETPRWLGVLAGIPLAWAAAVSFAARRNPVPSDPAEPVSFARPQIEVPRPERA